MKIWCTLTAENIALKKTYNWSDFSTLMHSLGSIGQFNWSVCGTFAQLSLTVPYLLNRCFRSILWFFCSPVGRAIQLPLFDCPISTDQLNKRLTLASTNIRSHSQFAWSMHIRPFNQFPQFGFSMVYTM